MRSTGGLVTVITCPSLIAAVLNTAVNEYEVILVATDGSGTASAAVDHAISLARGIGDTVYVLSVADPKAAPMAFGADTVAAIENAIDEVAEEMNEHLGECDIRVAVRRGLPAEEIRGYADETNADIVVLGRSGRATRAVRMTGSTADHIVQHSTRPIVLVPPSPSE